MLTGDMRESPTERCRSCLFHATQAMQDYITGAAILVGILVVKDELAGV